MCLPFLAPLGLALGASASASASTAAAIGTMAAATVASGAFSAYSSIEQGNFQSKVAKNNAITQNQLAEANIKDGEAAEAKQRLANAQIRGEQRAALGANNVALDSGSASLVLQDTAQLGELEAQTVRTNASRAAFGNRVSATNSISQSRLASSAGQMNAFGSILGSGASLSSDLTAMRAG